jgi:Glucose-6-phosphate dehydrogenase, C-terminal domain
MALDAVPMDFAYASSFRPRSAEAYERLLHDAMAGDQTLFLRKDAVERSWQIVAPILDAPGPVHPYAAGHLGPGRRRRTDRPARLAPGLSPTSTRLGFGSEARPRGFEPLTFGFRKRSP